VEEDILMSEHRISISKEELQMHGCKNCVWKLHGQCPHGLTGNQILEAKTADDIKGICKEYTLFLFSFSEGVGSVTELWEKFHLYIARITSLEDYKGYMQLGEAIKFAEEELRIAKLNHEDPKLIIELDKKVDELESKKNAYKMWWMKLNEQVGKGMAKVTDRERKVTPESRPQLTVQQLAQMVHGAAKELAAHEAKRLEKK